MDAFKYAKTEWARMKMNGEMVSAVKRYEARITRAEKEAAAAEFKRMTLKAEADDADDAAAVYDYRADELDESGAYFDNISAVNQLRQEAYENRIKAAEKYKAEKEAAAKAYEKDEKARYLQDENNRVFQIDITYYKNSITDINADVITFNEYEYNVENSKTYNNARTFKDYTRRGYIVNRVTFSSDVTYNRGVTLYLFTDGKGRFC